MKLRSLLILPVFLALAAASSCARDYAFLDDVRDLDTPRPDGFSPDGHGPDVAVDAPTDTPVRTDIADRVIRDVPGDLGMDAPCVAPRMMCGVACVDTSSDANHCGSCALACPTGQICANGACGCASGTQLCGASCIDIQNDTANCGGCNFRCATGASCVSGTCKCSGAAVVCGTAPGVCADTASDPGHCGDCATACTGTATTCCNSGCSDLQSDYNNCGRCGLGCGSGYCSGGVCVCNSGALMCNGTCANPMVDAANCGFCGNACGPTQSCVNGSCCNGVGLGEACAGSFQCCDQTASCRPYSLGSTNLCCHEAGQPCPNGALDCCGTMPCTSGLCQCQPAGTGCAANADCCSLSCNASNVCN